jgi:methyl-accepting chemotaxis protein
MKHIGLGVKIILLTTFVVFVTSLGLIYISFYTSYKPLEQSNGTRLQAIATTSALMLNGKRGDIHKKLDIDNKDRAKRQAQSKDKDFQSIQTLLRKIKDKNKLKEAIYTFRLSEGTLKFGVMTQKNTYIGDSYKPKDFRAKDSVLRAYDNKVSSRTTIYRSPNGVWISGHAPFFTSNDKIAGVVAIDIRFETFQQQLIAKVTNQLLVSLGILLFGLLLSFVFSNQLVKRLRYLREAAEQISLGEMEKVIAIDSNDELGQLAQSLERMRESLKVAMEMLDDDDDDD